MNQRKLNKAFIWGFLFLYLMVALISFCHAVQFFNIGNEQWMSIVLAFSFELGLALSLASILLSDKNKSQTFPWILMIALTTVQVVGNVYSVFKHVSLSQEDYYQYLAKPLLFFMEEVDENTIQVVVSWIMGAILPIVALLMTDMVASNIKHASEEDDEKLPETFETKQVEAPVETHVEVQKPVYQEPVQELAKISEPEYQSTTEEPVKISEPAYEAPTTEIKEILNTVEPQETLKQEEIQLVNPTEPILRNPAVFDNISKADDEEPEEILVDDNTDFLEPVESEEYIPEIEELNSFDSLPTTDDTLETDITKNNIEVESTGSSDSDDELILAEPVSNEIGSDIQEEPVEAPDFAAEVKKLEATESEPTESVDEEKKDEPVNIIDVIMENLDSSILGKAQEETEHSKPEQIEPVVKPTSVSVNDVIQNLDKTTVKDNAPILERTDGIEHEVLNATGYNKKIDNTYFAESIPGPFTINNN